MVIVGARWIVWSTLLGACSFDPNAARDASSGDDTMDLPTLPACVGTACRRRTITIDHTKVTGGPHVAFPLLVRLSDPDLQNTSAPNGFDIVFTSADGATKLAYEREPFVGGELVAWVAVPSVSSEADTAIEMYYGDPAAAVDAQDPAGAWDASYQGVWHFEELGTLEITDSTTHANHGTAQGGLTLGAAGKIGTAAQFGGIDGCVRVPQSTSLDQAGAIATLELWVYWTNTVITSYQRLLLTNNSFAGDTTGPEWATNPSGYHYYYPSNAGATSNYVAIVNPFVNMTWHHLALTQDFAARSVAMYIDGSPVVFDDANVATSWLKLATPGDWYWGGAPPRNAFAGMMDEIRISSVVRSAGWIATEHANQRSPSTFYSVGEVVVGP
jgi:biopolymer transport protein ExbB